MERQPEDNPFLALFEPLQVQAPISPHRPKQSTPPISRDLSNEESTKILQRVNTLIEDIFAITINPYGFLGRNSNDPGTLFDYLIHTGKIFSEALIFALTNPQYDDIMFIELQVQHVKIPSSEHGGEHDENMLCTQIVLYLCFAIQNNG